MWPGRAGLQNHGQTPPGECGGGARGRRAPPRHECGCRYERGRRYERAGVHLYQLHFHSPGFMMFSHPWGPCWLGTDPGPIPRDRSLSRVSFSHTCTQLPPWPTYTPSWSPPPSTTLGARCQASTGQPCAPKLAGCSNSPFLAVHPTMPGLGKPRYRPRRPVLFSVLWPRGLGSACRPSCLSEDHEQH